jgi:tetratricopeptide (TPR) repeat protein
VIVFRHLAVLSAVASGLQAGILITRNAQGFQFADAASVLVNGKDKVLNLGADPKLGASKPASAHLGGSLFLDADTKVIASYEDGAVEYLLPEGLPKNGPGDAAAAWKSARIAFKKASSDKTPTDVAIAEFVAFLAEGPTQLTRAATDRRSLELIGGKAKTLDTQLQFIAAVVKAYPSDSAVAPLENFVLQAMQQRYDRFETGTAGLDVLHEALLFSQISANLYPKQPEQAKMRDTLATRKGWLDRKAAVLKAFAAVQDWDDVLVGDREFERYLHAFPEMASLHGEALKQSLTLHRLAGEERLAQSDFSAAFREFRLASYRQPSDKILQQKVLMAWTDYSRRAASDSLGSRKQLSSGQREAINQALRFASGYKEQNKLDLALKSVLEAEAIDADSLAVLLKKAEILGAKGEFNEALDTLDRYDLHAVDDERAPASTLRGDLLFKRISSVEDIKVQLRSTWAAGDFHKMRDMAVHGLTAKDDDPELLYQAGMASLAMRNVQDGKGYFARYLDVSNTLDADQDQRIRVRTVLANLGAAAGAMNGTANWMSGMRLANDVFYCPVSLAFQAHVDHIEASNKMRVAYNWDGDRLRSITPTFEKAEHATGEKMIAFSYDAGSGAVNVVDYVNARSLSFADLDEMYKHSAPLLSNNAYVDPIAIQRLTGKDVAIGVAGNKYFQPFVWDGIHYFRFTYDSRGRVALAREITDASAAPGDSSLEFDWNGWQLAAIRGFHGLGNQRRQIYERTMEYQDGRLVSEQIQSQGKSWRIKYNYAGGKLAAANCDRDPSLDDRSRQVTFR